jgi:hypothetical protein
MIDQASLIVGDGNWAVKSDSLLGYKIINKKYYPREMSVTRATTATRVNEDGLIEVVPYNLVQYSEQFDNGVWTKNSSTITENTTTAPNGTLTADTLNVTASAFSGVIRAISGSSSNYTLSIYAKKNTKNWLYFIDVQGSNARAWFNLDTGTLGTVAIGYTATITAVGNGWYRCTLSNNNPQTLAFYQLGLADANNANTPASSGSAFLWGAQLVEGSAPKDYLPTTDRLDIARIDYSTGEAALLVEPQRTNLFTYSEQFDDASWTKLNTSVTANATIAPSGLMTADTMAVSGTLSRVVAANVLTAGTYTISVWAKVLSGSGAMRFNLIIDGVTTNFSFTPTTEWQRFTQTFTATTSVSSISFRGLGFVGDLAIWGAQLEAGSNATSYIPTVASAVTRNADIISKTGIADLIGQTEGTVFVDIDLKELPQSTQRFIQLKGTSFDIFIRSGAYAITGMPTISFTAITGRMKIAAIYSDNLAKLFVNGIEIGSRTSVTISNTNNIGIGNDSLSGNINSKVQFNSIQLYKTALTDQECINLTTL